MNMRSKVRMRGYQEEGLPGHPSERDQPASRSKRGVVGGIERSRHTTLADLHSVAGEHQHISDGRHNLRRSKHFAEKVLMGVENKENLVARSLCTRSANSIALNPVAIWVLC